MTFGKNQDASIEGKKGGKVISQIRNNSHIKSAIKKWENPNFREKGLIQLAEARKKINTSEAGKKSRIYENDVAKSIIADEIFLPQEVCDRIIIRDGKLFFIEIKRKGQRLRPKQKKFQLLTKDQYQILYGK